MCSQDVTQKPGQVIQYYPHPKRWVWSYTPTFNALIFNCSLAPSFELLSPPGEHIYVLINWIVDVISK